MPKNCSSECEETSTSRHLTWGLNSPDEFVPREVDGIFVGQIVVRHSLDTGIHVDEDIWGSDVVVPKGQGPILMKQDGACHVIV